VRLSVEAETLPLLFERVAQDVTRTLLPSEAIGAALREKLTVEAADLSALLKNWIDALLACLYEQRMAFSEFKILRLDHQDNLWSLQTETTGEILNPILEKNICSSAIITQAAASYAADIHIDRK
jgi:SHS2 domain-containing protein